MSLVAPHGGTRVDRITADPTTLRARAATLPRVTLDARELADLELIATGAASPLTGFIGRADYEAILATSRLASGVVWPFPFTLAVGPEVPPTGELALFEADRLRGVLRIADVFERATERELDAVYGTRDPAHPGVAYTLSRPTRLVGGEVEVLQLTPSGLRAEHRVPPQAGATGFILAFTGLSGAGKTTLATAIARVLGTAHRLEILDGDEVRRHLSSELGFSRQDRDTNVHRIGYVARTLAQHGVGVITAAISPYAATRREVRELAEQRGIAVLEVFANATLEALIARDVKGLYKQALAGEVQHFTGISDPYEAPTSPEVEVRTDCETIAQSVAKILAALQLRGLVASPPFAPANHTHHAGS